MTRSPLTHFGWLTSLCLGLALISGNAVAADADASDAAPSAAGRSVVDDVPKVAYVYEALGGTAKSVGAAGFAVTRITPSTPGSDPWLGGGGRVWGSPIERLTLMAEGQRRDNGAFAPSAGGLLRVLGGRREHYALSVLGQYLAEGFADLGGEVEAGILA